MLKPIPTAEPRVGSPIVDRAGSVQGDITNGEIICFRGAFKLTATIMRE